MERRELLKLIALFTGGAMIGGDIFLSGCQTPAKTGAHFSASDLALLDEVGETIIPATDTPGAKAAQVSAFMKLIVTDCYTQAEQDVFMKGMEQLEDACKKLNGKSFMDCTAQQRHDFLLTLEKEAKAYNEEVNKKDKPGREQARKEGKPYEFIASPKHYYTMIRQLTIGGYFSSKIGCKQALRYLPVPGKYDGAYPYKKGDRAFHE